MTTQPYNLTPADLQDLRDSIKQGRMADGCGGAIPAPFVVYGPPDDHYYLPANGYVWARHRTPAIICAAMRMARTEGARWLARVFENRDETCEELLLAAEASAFKRAQRQTEALHRDRLAAKPDLSSITLDDLLG